MYNAIALLQSKLVLYSDGKICKDKLFSEGKHVQSSVYMIPCHLIKKGSEQ